MLESLQYFIQAKIIEQVKKECFANDPQNVKEKLVRAIVLTVSLHKLFCLAILPSFANKFDLL